VRPLVQWFPVAAMGGGDDFTGRQQKIFGPRVDQAGAELREVTECSKPMRPGRRDHANERRVRAGDAEREKRIGRRGAESRAAAAAMLAQGSAAALSRTSDGERHRHAVGSGCDSIKAMAKLPVVR